MFPSLDNEPARLVLAQFPAGCETVPRPLGNHGGFSGASLWRCEGGGHSYCLRAWPQAWPAAEHLTHIHHLMTTALRAGLGFVPEVFPSRSGASRVRFDARLWELTRWMPGSADFHADPATERLHVAGLALARLHEVWERSEPVVGPCPAVERRLRKWREWQDLLRTGWRPREWNALVGRAWSLLSLWMPRVPVLLGPWHGRTMSLQPCLCDVWHDHLLFEGNRLTGLIDYGAVKRNHVAADLARLLGSLVGDDSERWSEGLRAYRAVRRLSTEEEGLARTLDRAGTILAVAGWLRWLYHDGRQFDDMAAVARQLAAIVARMENWRPDL